ncbi:MAG: 4Fe-4S binding protein [Bacteroidetes bacterium]|nr:4Fe-4S binding protein [Bacteroidota bacterium]
MQKIRNIVFYIFMLMLALQSYDLSAKNRFPKPEFESGHTQPKTITPSPRTLILEYLDVMVLLVSISLISWLILKKRSRKGVFLTGIFSILYFGFYREGCICSIGSIQNVVLALFNTQYKIPLTALLFFIIPVLYTLFFGRTFCAGICPLGAIQDIIAVKPIPVKIWLEKVLGIIPFIYLAFAILYAATASDFIICRYDPFVGFYRFDASFMMFVIGGLLLLIGIFIARPYCRYLCPYGALLNIVSRFSFIHMKITPAECINCKLCENSCPYSAINIPATHREKEKTSVMVKRYIMLSLILPVLVVAGGFITSNFHENLAMVNHKVKLASEILHNSNYGIKGKEAIEITAFKSSGQTVTQLNTEAAAIIAEFKTASWFTGAFIGLVIGLTLIGLSVFKYHVDYTPNKASCLSCARCMDYCPVLPEKKL